MNFKFLVILENGEYMSEVNNSNKNKDNNSEIQNKESENNISKSKKKKLDHDISLMKKELDKAKKSTRDKKDKFFNENNNKNSNNSDNKKNPKKKRPIIIAICIIAVLVGFFGMQFFNSANELLTDELSTSDFIQAVEQERVQDVTYDTGSYTVRGSYYTDKSDGSVATEGYNNAMNALNDATTSLNTENNTQDTNNVATQGQSGNAKGSLRNYTATFVGQDSLLELMQKHPNIKYEITLPSGWMDTLSSLLPIILVAVLMFFFFSQMTKFNNQQMGFGKTKAKKSSEEVPKVKFSDVAGVDEAVEEMSEVKDFLSNPKKYFDMGAKIPRGCLLVGPPGTGKTLLARAVAGEAGVPFFNISGSDFVEMFVGVGASRVRDLFKQAKQAAPSIIFIDEIDAVGRHRGAGLGGGHDEREQTLNQMLVEMDGFDQNDSVVLIAATNRADILDPALLRPGRFDRQIVVDAPDVKGREKILHVHAKGKPIEKTVDFWRLAQLTPGFTGADLANLLNEAALLAARKNKKTISQEEVSESMERVIAGPERKSRLMDKETKNIIAFHESGHALIGHLLPKANPVHKISIISRGRALGYTLSIPKEDKVLNSYQEMNAELAVFMGGRVAEEIFCEDITTGASNDLERATKIARSIVTQYGMSKNLGTQVFGQPNHEVFLGKDYGNTKDYSEHTAERIDEEVSKIMKLAHDKAYEILTSNSDQMRLMARVLLDRETVEGKACDMLLEGKWDEYLKIEQAENKKQRDSKESFSEHDEVKKTLQDNNKSVDDKSKMEDNQTPDVNNSNTSDKSNIKDNNTDPRGLWDK